jgi:hypothetical protein
MFALREETKIEAEAGTQSADTRAASFNMCRRISSTTYEVSIYFSLESKETLDDKILRLVRGCGSHWK